MALDFDFTETAQTLTLTFYVPPRTEKEPTFVFEEPQTLLVDAAPIKLFRPVHPPTTERTRYFLALTFEKATPGKWYAVEGPPSSGARRIDDTAVPCSDDTPQGLFDVLCDIYAKGSDEVRLAMNKSLQESGGTVLSTDWNEVQKKEVKPEE